MPQRDDQEIYEEEIGLRVDDNGDTYIENNARQLPHPPATARVLVRCEWCKRTEPAAYIREPVTDETRFRFKSSMVSVIRWKGLTGTRKWIDRRFCQDCEVERNWIGAGIELIEGVTDSQQSDPASERNETTDLSGE